MSDVRETHRGHRYVQWVLRAGLAVSALLVVAGLAIAIAGGEHVSTAVDLRSLLHAGTLADRLMASGLVVLCVTPIIRVIALIAIWIDERDRTFAVVGFIVLAILSASIWWGHT